VSELGPNAFGEPVDPGRVDCNLALPPPADDADEQGGVLVVAPRWLLHPAVPQPAGSLVYELATGHPDRQPGELVFLADLTVELRAWPQQRWAALGSTLRTWPPRWSAGGSAATSAACTCPSSPARTRGRWSARP
jgi:hypothetical protein